MENTWKFVGKTWKTPEILLVWKCGNSEISLKHVFFYWSFLYKLTLRPSNYTKEVKHPWEGRGMCQT